MYFYNKSLLQTDIKVLIVFYRFQLAIIFTKKIVKVFIVFYRFQLAIIFTKIKNTIFTHFSYKLLLDKVVKLKPLMSDCKTVYVKTFIANRYLRVNSVAQASTDYDFCQNKKIFL